MEILKFDLNRVWVSINCGKTGEMAKNAPLLLAFCEKAAIILTIASD
ncbi:MAG: hypothetical protein ACLFRG_17580 [Desulfococcaceae bacterium]